MGRTAKQPGGKSQSVYFYPNTLAICYKLMELDNSKSVSSICNDAICTLYADIDPDNELLKERNQAMFETYKKRRQSMMVNGDTYPKFQMSWIEAHFDTLSKMFPGKDMSEIFDELERECMNEVRPE